MPVTTRHQSRAHRAGKVYVNTKCSTDGRTLEGFWLDRNLPVRGSNMSIVEEDYAFYLLQRTWNASEMVDYYTVYDLDGNVDKNFNPEAFPKRTC